MLHIRRAHPDSDSAEHRPSSLPRTEAMMDHDCIGYVEDRVAGLQHAVRKVSVEVRLEGTA